MTKRILHTLLAFSLMTIAFQLPAQAEIAEPAADIAAPITEDIRLTVSGQNIRVQNGQGQTLEVFGITGAKVLAVRIDNADKTINLSLARGCYIVKVGNIARKVAIS